MVALAAHQKARAMRGPSYFGEPVDLDRGGGFLGGRGTLVAQQRFDGEPEVGLLAERGAVGHLHRAGRLPPVIAEAAARADLDVIQVHPGGTGADWCVDQDWCPFRPWLPRPPGGGSGARAISSVEPLLQLRKETDLTFSLRDCAVRQR